MHLMNKIRLKAEIYKNEKKKKTNYFGFDMMV